MSWKMTAAQVCALFMTVCGPMAWAGTIDFEDGASMGGTPIDNFYQSLGVTFSNSVWITADYTGVDNGEFWYGNAGLGAEVGESAGDTWAFPGLTNPILVSFSSPMAFVSIDALDVGDNGAGLLAYDAHGNLIGQDTAQGSGIGYDNDLTLSVSAAGIASIALNQPFYTDGDDDGLGWDNLTFSATAGSVPEPSTLVLGLVAVIFGGCALRCRRAANKMRTTSIRLFWSRAVCA